jgi:hypothetical protein
MINKKSLLLLFICVAVPHQLQAAGMDSPRIKALSSRRDSLAGTSELVPANVAAAHQVLPANAALVPANLAAAHTAAGLPPAPAAGAAAGAPAAPTFDLAAFNAGKAKGRASVKDLATKVTVDADTRALGKFLVMTLVGDDILSRLASPIFTPFLPK